MNKSEERKAKENEYSKAYYQRNKDLINERRRERRNINKAHHAALAKKYRESNKEERLKKEKVSRQKERVEKPWLVLLRPARKRSKDNGLEFDLDREWAKSRWTGRCELTGIEFDLTSKGRGGNPLSPSIDRIDPKSGYTKDNCRVILWCINAFKQTLRDDELKPIVVKLYESMV